MECGEKIDIYSIFDIQVIVIKRLKEYMNTKDNL
jgi:hypothetical protein